MSEFEDKLTAADVLELMHRAHDPLPDPAQAAQDVLREAVAKGESAFSDPATFLATQRLVRAYLDD